MLNPWGLYSPASALLLFSRSLDPKSAEGNSPAVRRALAGPTHIGRLWHADRDLLLRPEERDPSTSPTLGATVHALDSADQAVGSLDAPAPGAVTVLLAPPSEALVLDVDIGLG